MAELDDRLDMAIAVALEASAIPRRYYRNEGMVVDFKADDTPVTRADKETEIFMRERIEAACPRDAIVGEEFPSKPGTTGFKWYLDPIDGTQSFIRGVPLFGTMVALEHGNDAVIGVISFPALGEIVYAAKGKGAWWATDAKNARRTRDLDVRAAVVSRTSDLAEASLNSGGLELYPAHGLGDGLQRLLASVKIARSWSDCYGHYLVATGRMDVMVDPEMNVWDNAPLLPIMVEAGGRFTDLAGNPTIHGGSGISTNGRLHEAVLRELRSR